MKTETRVVTIMFVTSLLTGCAALSSDGTALSKGAANGSGRPQASPAFRAQNHYEWVKRLKVAKPMESLEGTIATQGASSMMPIPLPPTSLQQYALVVDQQQQLAWLQGTENYGPFPLSNPDVAHLMNSIAAAYQEQAAWQASMQRNVMQQMASSPGAAAVVRPMVQQTSFQQNSPSQPAPQPSVQPSQDGDQSDYWDEFDTP